VKWATVACSLALASFAGCSCGKDRETEPGTGVARAVGETVESLEQAIARGDWRAVCDDIFTPAARRRAGGDACPRLLRSDAGGLRRPRIRILRIEVEGSRARAQVRSRARGQQPITDVIELRRMGGRYRVEALAR
jgi:hypothetical protein